MSLWTPRRFGLIPLAGVLIGLTTAACAAARFRSTATGPLTPEQVTELWAEPADIPSRELFYGPGGQEWMPAPGSTFQFVNRDTGGYSWGWDVKDARGVRWSVKYGPEAQVEVVLSRLLWAIGYHQPATYYVERWSLAGGGSPGPQTPSRFRPLVPGWKKSGNWSWYENPFVDTQPFRGLIVFMRIVNNWDTLRRNNTVYEVDPPLNGARRLYIVQDLGASLGKTNHFVHQGTRNDVEGFERETFIKDVSDGEVRFGYRGWRHRGLRRGLTPADVRWTCQRLDRLTSQQWRDAFRAARYTDEQAERYIRKIRKNVAQGLGFVTE